MRWPLHAMAALAVIVCLPPAAQATPPAMQPLVERELDDLYARIGADLARGEPLVIHAYYGMWQVRPDEPERNLNWGGYYGHRTMMMRARKDKHIAALYAHHDWRLVYEEAQPTDPLRTLVFHQRVTPNEAWRAQGVREPFDVYLVMEAWQGQEQGAEAMTRHLRRSEGRVFKVEGRDAPLDTSSAHAVGYFGHNFFYDYEDFRYDGLDQITGQISAPTGVFVVGCNTARVPGFDRLLTPNAYALLYSRSLMASEGYSTLSLAEGLIQRMRSAQLVRHADKTYKYFQTLNKPRRVGSPFVGQNYRLVPAR
jgi:hypothetical protein